MDDSGWLSTRNKKKVTKPQSRLKKMRSSTLKPMKSSSLPITYSPPPKELFTATKQSSLNDFFSAQQEPQMEVEVNFDHDSQAGKSEQNSQGNDNITLSDTNTDTECNRMSENKNISETQCAEYSKKDRTVTRKTTLFTEGDKETITSDMTVFTDTEKETKANHELAEHVNVIGRDSERNISAETTTENLNDRRSVKRIHYVEESNVSLDIPKKRARLDIMLPEKDLKLTEDCAQTCNFIANNEDDNYTQTHKIAVNDNTVHQLSIDVDLEVGSEYNIDSEDITGKLPLSCVSSQSLDLGSPLKSQEFESLNTLKFDTQNDYLSKGLEKKSLVTLRSLNGDSLTFPSHTEDTDTSQNILSGTINDVLSLSTDHQSDSIERKCGNLLSSASLDLSSQTDLFDTGAKASDAAGLLYDGSQLSLSCSSPESVSEYQSLDLS